ncbi:MAG: Ig-like domain-containing protein [bacterium]
MKTIGLAATILILFTSVAWFAGCGGDDPVSQAASPAPEIAGVSPADGATGVATSTAITVDFDMPMDPQSVMENFYVSGGDEMHEWMDSLTYHHNHHHGDWMMDLDHMMEWMDDIHIPGEFHWNDAHDRCEFVPSPGLDPDTDLPFPHGPLTPPHGPVTPPRGPERTARTRHRILPGAPPRPAGSGRSPGPDHAPRVARIKQC